MEQSSTNRLVIGGLFVLVVLGCGLLVWLFVSLVNITTVSDSPSPEPTSQDPFPGVLVVEVMEGSPAEAAGLRRGHLLLSMNGTAVNQADAIAETVASLAAGSEITFILEADGGMRQTTVIRGDTPPYLGLTLIDRTQEDYLEQIAPPTAVPDVATPPSATEPGPTPPNTSLPTITAVAEGSPGAVAGLQVGDIITQVDGESLLSVEELVAAIGQRPPGTAVSLTIRRGPDTVTVTAVLGASPDEASRGFLGVTIE